MKENVTTVRAFLTEKYFQLLLWIAHFRDLEDQKIQVGRDLKMGRFFTSLSLTNVSIYFRNTYLKGFNYNVDT